MWILIQILASPYNKTIIELLCNYKIRINLKEEYDEYIYIYIIYIHKRHGNNSPIMVGRNKTMKLNILIIIAYGIDTYKYI